MNFVAVAFLGYMTYSDFRRLGDPAWVVTHPRQYIASAVYAFILFAIVASFFRIGQWRVSTLATAVLLGQLGTRPVYRPEKRPAETES
ncbi:hypothetical protein HYV72_01715 [Candidatus Uhrbacteria bacterium]|nr:hypothetical protein [Candidatus Uhrbacteria bacterium]